MREMKKPLFWQQNKVFCFFYEGGENSYPYPFIFFHELFAYLDKHSLFPLPFYYAGDSSFESGTQLSPRLFQTVLGQEHFYWLGALTQSKQQHQKVLFDYQGPHILGFFIENFDEKSVLGKGNETLFISLSSTLTLTETELLLASYGKRLHEEKSLFLKRLFEQSKTLSLIFVHQLFVWLDSINVSSLEQFEDYITKTQKLDKSSLVLLTEYFFARDAYKFFAQWQLLEATFSAAFWISFWAECLWQAYFVRDCMEKRDFAKAKKIGFRLPFSFMKSDWKKHSKEDLAQLYALLYQVDFSFKRGSHFCLFDLFYVSHFSKH